MDRVGLEFNRRGNLFSDCSADPASFRVPLNMVANFEFVFHRHDSTRAYRYVMMFTPVFSSSAFDLIDSCPFCFTFKITPPAKLHRSAAESETAPRSWYLPVAVRSVRNLEMQARPRRANAKQPAFFPSRPHRGLR